MIQNILRVARSIFVHSLFQLMAFTSVLYAQVKGVLAMTMNWEKWMKKSTMICRNGTITFMPSCPKMKKSNVSGI